MNHHSQPPAPFPDPLPALVVPPSADMLRRLETRRSVPLRSFAEPGPTAAEIDQMLSLAIRVPDHGRLAPWRFILVEGESRGRLGAALDALYARQHPDLAAGKANMWTIYMMRAPLTVVLVSRPDPAAKVPEWNQILSAGAAGMALTVAANALGFATQWLLKWPGRDREATALLGVGTEERIAGFIHIGRPSAIVADRPRPSIETVVSRWAPQSPISNDTP